MSIPKNCVFCTTTNSLIDFIPDDSDGTAAIAKFTAEYGPALIILPVDEAWATYENQFKSEPVEITEERYHEMLNILPPVAWVFDAPSFESFKICELTAGSITAIFVRVHNRYFEFSDTITLPHRACVTRVLCKFYPEAQS